jgi:hypothetical protein
MVTNTFFFTLLYYTSPAYTLLEKHIPTALPQVDNSIPLSISLQLIVFSATTSIQLSLFLFLYLTAYHVPIPTVPNFHQPRLLLLLAGSSQFPAFSTKSTTEGNVTRKMMNLMTMVAPWRGYPSRAKRMILSAWPPLSKIQRGNF